jgi:hypothetical protein
MSERLPFNVLHFDEVESSVLANRVNRHHMGMDQCRGVPRLGEKRGHGIVRLDGPTGDSGP